MMIQCRSLHPICRWVEDGSLVEDSGSFTNWAEDNNEGEIANCMKIWYDNDHQDGTWYYAYCDSTYPAVCSKPIASSAAPHNITRA